MDLSITFGAHDSHRFFFVRGVAEMAEMREPLLASRVYVS